MTKLKFEYLNPNGNITKFWTKGKIRYFKYIQLHPIKRFLNQMRLLYWAIIGEVREELAYQGFDMSSRIQRLLYKLRGRKVKPKKPYLVITANGTSKIVGIKNPNVVKPKRGKDGKLYIKYKTQSP